MKFRLTTQSWSTAGYAVLVHPYTLMHVFSIYMHILHTYAWLHTSFQIRVCVCVWASAVNICMWIISACSNFSSKRWFDVRKCRRQTCGMSDRLFYKLWVALISTANKYVGKQREILKTDPNTKRCVINSIAKQQKITDIIHIYMYMYIYSRKVNFDLL